MKLSRNTKCATVVAALAMAATTGIGAVASNTTNVDAATVAHVTDGASVYKADGKIITNRALAPNTDWLVGKIATINGETMYQVATNEYLRARDSSLSGQSNQAQPTKLVGTATSPLSLYRDDTNSMSNRALANGSAWQVGKLVVNKLGQEFAQVSTHEYADASKLQFNMAKPSPTYIADFGITKTSSNTNSDNNTNNSGSTDTNTNTSTGTDTSTDTNTGSTTTDNNNSGSTTTGTDTNTGSTTTSDDSQSAYQQAILADVNKARAEVGLAPLTLNSKLNAAAAIRAQEISTDFSHTRPDGSTNASAVNDPAYVKGSTFGENIAAINDNGHMSATRLEKEHLARFTGEPGQGHYKNWQYAGYKSIGIAVYHANDGFYYVVEDMATIA